MVIACLTRGGGLVFSSVRQTLLVRVPNTPSPLTVRVRNAFINPSTHSSPRFHKWCSGSVLHGSQQTVNLTEFQDFSFGWNQSITYEVVILWQFSACSEGDQITFRNFRKQMQNR